MTWGRWLQQTILLALACLVTTTGVARAERRPLVLAHYMPWYVAKPTSDVWGWHWTMNHFNPDENVDGKRAIASHFYPEIGPYDSGDPRVIEYHLLLMKLAGIDGVIVDWYGLTKHNDYAILHSNTTRLIEAAERMGMRFVICYEDQTIPRLVKAGKLDAAKRVPHAVGELQWLSKHWFKLRGYVRRDGKPVLLSFGQSGLANDEWTECLRESKLKVAYFSEHIRRDSAMGAFDWPIPKEGVAATERFRKQSATWPAAIPVCFPRFVDVYRKAGLHDGYGRIDDSDGRTFSLTLRSAMKSGSDIVQVATWNDWGEGTQIEPGSQFGYRDLKLLQQYRRDLDSDFRIQAAALRLPARLFAARRANKPGQKQQLDRVSGLLTKGNTAEAREILDRLEIAPKP